MRTRRFAGALGLLSAATIVAGALSPVGAAGTTRIRVLHASPDAPAVDVWVDGSKALTNVAFKGLSSYLTVPSGAHHIQVVATGTTSPAVIDATPTFDAGKSYTVAASGKLASIAPAVFVDDSSAIAGKSKLRVVHLSPDAPAVDVAVTGQTPAEAPVKNLAFPNATGYLTLAPDTYDFEVRLTGTTNVALPLDNVTLAGDTNYSVFAVGLVTDPPAGQALTAVVGVDGTAVPETSTVSDGIGGGSPALPIAAAAALAGIAGSVVFLRYRPAEARDRKR